MKKIEIPSCKVCRARGKSVFADLSSPQIEEMERRKGCNFYKKGQIIFMEGSHPTGLYCIHKGKVKIYKIGEIGREQIVRLAGEGDILGYRSLISGEPYRATAETLEDSLICQLPHELFFEMIQTDHQLAMQLMQFVCKELGAAESRMLHLAQKPVRERLAEVLLLLREKYGLLEDGKTLNIQITREDLANIVGTATETTIRLLSEFKEQQLIGTRGRRLQILNPHQLARMANLYD